ncbi:LysR family transcriptional regulator [Ancylobacter dichloromethanicus]|uniref:LysR family transcriptional regulator n=1 Tax=Ancylobacter dichloromethanicus TaxID=518825 RepID=A0A9W6J8V9_9HYPH|nr:LysR family transcriptional regulator [Ancylobacter dichloromethanicus]MBS7554409.1 LysR family transcriptional regulator [Ancylobacter dichloromethanicus]GLK71534.1 LysR family transcriptional regulator [Ancylobacter dichloromethanicus]
MDTTDLNLLPALDALLTEGSVTGAARRLGLSSSAMSRTLARLRFATGDPLLVRAGRGLVPTPRAIALRDRVHTLAREARDVLSPQDEGLDLATLDRTFTLRANEGFVGLFSAPLISTVIAAAPHARLRFAPKPMKDSAPLREGVVDLEIGVLGAFAPEVRTHFLFRDRFIGVVRAGHTLLSAPVTPQRYAAARHVVVSRRGSFTGPVDEALERLGLRREIVAVVPGFPDALRIARQSELVALIPRSCLGDESFVQGLASFELPVTTPEIVVSAMWHPRMDADPAHRWLRNVVISVCGASAP